MGDNKATNMMMSTPKTTLAVAWLVAVGLMQACQGSLGDSFSTSGDSDRSGRDPTSIESGDDGNPSPGSPGDDDPPDSTGSGDGDDSKNPMEPGDDGDDPSPEPDEPGSGMDAPAPPMTKFQPPDPTIVEECGAEVPMTSANVSVRKLRKPDLLSALKDVFRTHHRYPRLEQVWEYRDLTNFGFGEADPLQMAVNAFAPDGSPEPGEVFNTTYSEDQLEAWAQVADIVAQEFVSQGWASTYADPSCFGQATASDACLEELAAGFGELAFRRPLHTDEVSRIVAFARGRSNTEASVYGVVSRILLSPQFMYQLEVGDADASDTDAERIRLSQHEIASRVSFALTGRAPDSQLLAAAAAGELVTVAAIRQHAMRLVRTAAAQDKLYGFFEDWLHLTELREPSQAFANQRMVPDQSGTANLYNANRLEVPLKREIEDFVKYVVWQQEGTYTDLMTERIAFPRDERLQVIYRTSTTDPAGGPVDAPGHPGILTRAGLLASDVTPNPIIRAIRIRESALCMELPMPDFSIVAARQDGLEDLDPIDHANHEIIANLTRAPACQGCHQYINPVGFLFETFNPLGQRDGAQDIVRAPARPEEWPQDIPKPTSLPEGVHYAVIATHPLPGPQDFVIEDGLPERFATADDLLDAIAASDRGPACMAVRVFRHLNRRSEQAADACTIKAGAERMKSGSLLEAFVDILVSEDIFWRKP